MNMPGRSPAVVQQQFPAAAPPAQSVQGYSGNWASSTPTYANGMGATPVQSGPREVILEPVR